MSKRTGSFESLIRGVSEQVPHDRFIGQHWAQDNMVSDPVRGLARRQGSRMITEKLAPGVVMSAATLADLKMYKEFTFFINSVEYSLMYRPTQIVAGSTMPGVICINKDTGVIMDTAVNAADLATMTTMLNSGFAAVGNIAKYLLLAPNSNFPQYTQVDKVLEFGATGAIWVRQGAYSRTYNVKFTRASGAVVSVSYTTPASYYPGVLTTADLDYTAADYQARVNDRVNAYQTAVNQWIGTAAAAIQPEAIAQQITNLIAAAGVVSIQRVGSHVISFDCIALDVDDNGDGTFMKGVAREVQSVNDLSPIHYAGKTVRIRPKGVSSDDNAGVYYLVARPKDGAGTGTFKEVIWTEGPGIEITPTFVTCLGQIIGNTLYLASTQSNLQAVTGDTNQTAYSKSSSGDLNSQSLPVFFNKKINHIGNFQDRLMLVSGSTVFLSKSGDYFNFFRASALTLADDDQIEVFALGSEGDVITDSVMTDRSLILFGKQRQYAMDGRTAMTPKTAYVATQSSLEDTTTCPPVASGNYVFFSQLRDDKMTMQQMQTGAYADSFQSFEVTTQLDGYLNGTPRQILALTSPSALFIRTQEFTNGFFVFNYLDNADQTQRLFDSWSKWSFNAALGSLIGITGNNGGVLALTLRQGANGVAFVLDRFSRSADLSIWPYLDSGRISTFNGSITTGWALKAQAAIALNKSAGQYFLLGQPLIDISKLVDAVGISLVNTAGIMGCLYESSFEPTSPYIRDSKDKAILNCTFTLGSYSITLAKSAAMRAYIRGMNADISTERLIQDWIYRPAGAWVLNTQQVAPQETVDVDVQEEIREFRLRLASRNWLPLTFSSIEWAGQFFTQRNA